MSAVRVGLLRGTLAAVAMIAFAACGNDSAKDSGDAGEPSPGASQSTSSATTPTSGFPACSDVWVAGQDLPADYKGCDQEGEVIKPTIKKCGSGLKLVTHDNRFYAQAGNKINDVGDLTTSSDYQSAEKACLA